MNKIEIATYVGSGLTIEEAASDAMIDFEQANNPPAAGAQWVAVNTQTLWHEPDKVFYHIISAVYQLSE